MSLIISQSQISEEFEAIPEENEHDNSYESKHKGIELLILTVDLGNGVQDNIVIHEHDEANALASKFCKLHGLNAEYQKTLAQQIEEQIERLLGEQRDIDESLNFMEEWHKALDVQLNRKQKNIPSINPLSRQIAENLRAQGSVYEKLHKDALRKQAVKVSQQEVLKDQNVSGPSSSTNYGQKLYYKGLKLKELSEKKREQMQKELQTREEQDITFQPQINPNSHSFIRRSSKAIEESFITIEKEKQERLEKMRAEIMNEQQQACTFKPKLNLNSLKLLENREKPEDKFEALYKEAEVRRGRLNQAVEEYEFI